MEKVYKNISGLEFVIIEKLDNRKVLVRFIDTNSIVKADGRNVMAGKIADPYHKSRLGIGYIGEYDKKPYHKKALQLWSNMMKRCYDQNDKKGYFGKTVIDARWHCFANFLSDLPSLVGFDHWLNNEKYQLDKDFKGDGTIYSRQTCSFIPEWLNKSAGKANKRLIDGKWVTSTF